MRMLLPLGAGVFAALCCVVMTKPRAAPLARLRRLSPPARKQPRTIPTRTLGGALAAVSVALFIGGIPGILAGGLAGVGVHRWLSSIPSSETVRRRRGRRAELPVVVELLAACLASGATVSRSLDAVVHVTRSDLREELHRVAAALSVGGSADEAWRLVTAPECAPLVAVMQRSAVTGAPASQLLSLLAADLRAQSRAASMTDAHQLGVRSAGPLGLCFLPAFVLIGVVPLVISLVQAWM